MLCRLCVRSPKYNFISSYCAPFSTASKAGRRSSRSRDSFDVLPSTPRRVSRRAIEKREQREQQLRKLKQKNIKKEEPDSPLFAKTPQDLWVKPKEPKFKTPEVPESQKNNFRYKQSPVMRIRDLALAGQAEEALKIFQSEVLKHHKDRIDEFTYNQLLLACARSAKWQLSFKIYNDMKKRALKPTIISITNLLNCLASVQYPTKEEKIKYTQEKLKYIVNEMDKFKIEPNTMSYNVMLKVVGSISDLKSTLRLVNEMHVNPNIDVDIATYTQLVETFGKDNLEAVFSIWDELKERDLQPSLQFFHSIMKYCNVHRKPELAIEISLQILEEKLSWDHRTISLLCNSYGLLGQCSYAGILLRKVDEYGIQMDSILWNSLLRLGSLKAWSLSKKSKWLSDIFSAEQLIDEMEKRLLATKASASTMNKTIDILKTEEIEALLFGSLNSALPKHVERYYAVLTKRNKDYKFTDHYQAKYMRLFAKEEPL